MTSNGVPTPQPPDSALDTMAGSSDPFPPPDPIRFPNTRRRASALAIKSRINPPDTNPADPDTCRICRGEGSPDEPLFYPCKCSGSIKFVHQDCLMEWLSHSQKKHCELCKTPFRFTKLYDPNMPKALPAHVFVSHTAKYLVRNLLVWARAALVGAVWLVCLPYVMRSVWSCLVWISDEGLGGRPAISATVDAFNLLSSAPYGSYVCPSSPLFAADTTPAAAARIVKNLYGINLTSSDPIYSTIMRLLLGGPGSSEKPAAALANATVRLPSEPSHQTLLGGIVFLRNLTRYPSVNRAIISVLEGQIITVVVIACFILIILVRDYVVQQQPEINMRAAFAAGDIPPQAADAEDNADVPDEEDDEEEEPLETNHDGPIDAFDGTEPANHPTAPFIPRHGSDPPGSSAGRPLIPNFAQNHPRPAPGFDRGTPMHEFDHATVHEYLDIYREAGGDPELILRIARERNLDTRLDYWMRLTRSMMDRQRESETFDDNQAGPSSAADTDSTNPEVGDASDKGKGRLVEDTEEDGNYSMGNPMRRRANTDGPPVTSSINPLANNSWSFAALPSPPPDPDPLFPDSPAHELEDSYPSWETPESSTGTRASSLVRDDPSYGPEVGPSRPHESPMAHGALQPDPPRREPAGLADRVADFMWRQVDDIDEAELAPVNSLGDFAEEEPDEDIPGNVPANPNGGNQDMADAAAADAVEDAEDLEGILELLGIRGPVAGLFQNAIFCAFLVSVTIFLGVFVPYSIGRVSIWALANPMRLARMLFSLSKFIQDCALLLGGLALLAISEWIRVLGRALMFPSLAEYLGGVVNASKAMALSAASRIASGLMNELPLISASEVRNFSAVSHEALLTLKDHIALAFLAMWRLLAFLLGGDYSVKGPQVLSVAANIFEVAWTSLKTLPTAIVNPSSWVLDLNLPEVARTVNPELAHWGAVDRFWAVLAGYAAITFLAGLYLRRGNPLSSSPAVREWEASIIDGLNQASGVMKVILIISIEMLVFPLYCGMLLDAALLPLFENATLKSRLLFTINFPITSIFVHWFVGTGYMFHFALFVSMCRKIMRKGVLYFIRDPDDPEFHPVRDVLERNVTTQLRKILFSAFVYGALVIVCLGGVVWGLSLCLPGVLPIHYSSNEPVLEFPIDLLFYNFLMPFAVRFFKPSHGLHAMYTWWFRRCARALRITWFLFGERRIDEEGQLALKPDSPDRKLPFWRRMFLEVDAHGKVVARTWRGIFEGGTAKRPTMKKEHIILYQARKASLVQSGQLIPNGRFVRTPASDQVKIPKGGTVFLEVDEKNTWRDGLADRPAPDIYSTKQYQLVYVPPHFHVRVFLFILSIWIFAAVTGVSITIVPLIFGRWMFGLLIPEHIQTNDVYAFSIGIHILGSAAYALFHGRAIYRAVKERATALVESVRQRDGVRKVIGVVARTARVIYAAFFVLIVCPLLIASLMELYALLPLHQIMYGAFLRPGFAAADTVTKANPVHTTRVVQAWTIGLLYLKLGMRITNTWFRGGRLSNAARAVLRRGWLDPDVAILTRCFIVPGLAMSLAAVAVPLLMAKAAIAEGLVGFLCGAFAKPEGAPDQGLVDAYSVLVYRMSFPAVALVIASVKCVWGLVSVFRSWQIRIRDEAYLIGERLHNFGATNAPRARGAWRAGGARL
ncbi:hypothetical protein N657DRAFT_651319 [Parathielavia appendiculata]|uniref:RING-type E3 ubiquitin transferase n=1 Tax=Parathielavia appendiculata TaxID=2587402 RepID=A0AAN6TPU3_9PEZI|nr:hypothetical protein N657DRAFT_651319 [Parathielavia appendiculata]